MTKTKKYETDNWNRPMGDADNGNLSNYKFKKIQIKFNNNKWLECIRK